MRTRSAWRSWHSRCWWPGDRRRASPGGRGGGLGAGIPATAEARVEGTEDVLLVGNNWHGTADVVDPVTFRRLLRINIVPDLAERRAEIMRDPVGFGLFLGVRLRGWETIRSGCA